MISRPASFAAGILLIVTTVAVALWAGSAPDPQSPSSDKETNKMSQHLPGSGASRVPPPAVDALVSNGIRYEPAVSGLPLDATDVTGWMRATNIASGEVIWLAQVYTHPDPVDPFLPGGGRNMIPMKRIALSGNMIEVEDLRGRTFLVDPATGTSTPAGG
jgi:hypothetical protein